MGTYSTTVLLVGNSSRSAPTLQDYFERKGCKVFFATSKEQARELLRRRRYDLVLSEFMLPDGTAYQLMPLLLGTDTTMFFSNTVEEGCWWMTAIFNGQDCSEEPGMRPIEFKRRLDEILLGKLLRNSGESVNKDPRNHAQSRS